MNLIKTNWFSSLLIFIVGIVLCFLCDKANVLVIIVYILGALFTLTGCINIIEVSMRHSSGKSNAITTTVGWLAGLGGIGLGAAMLIVPRSFTPILVYFFAALLVLGGLWHFIVLSGYYKKTGIPGWLYFIPLIILVAGVVMFCSATVRDNIKVSILISGIGAILYGITTLLEFIFSKVQQRRAKIEARKEQEAVQASTSGSNAAVAAEPATQPSPATGTAAEVQPTEEK